MSCYINLHVFPKLETGLHSLSVHMCGCNGAYNTYTSDYLPLTLHPYCHYALVTFVYPIKEISIFRGSQNVSEPQKLLPFDDCRQRLLTHGLEDRLIRNSFSWRRACSGIGGFRNRLFSKAVLIEHAAIYSPPNGCSGHAMESLANCFLAITSNWSKLCQTARASLVDYSSPCPHPTTWTK